MWKPQNCVSEQLSKGVLSGLFWANSLREELALLCFNAKQVRACPVWREAGTGSILCDNHAPPSIPSYEIMSACWRADPAARPTFSQLKVHLEKLLENLPALRSCGDAIYINTSLPEESPDSTQDSGFPQADSDLEPGDVSEPALVAVDVDVHPWGSRYVLEEQVAVPNEEPYVPLLPDGAATEGSTWSRAETLPVGTALCPQDSEVLL